MRFSLITAVVALSVAVPQAWVQGEEPALRAVTHEDVWLMHRLGTPVASPDGRWAVFQVTEPAYEGDDTVSDLWVVDVGGDAPPRRLTSTPSSESDVAWSPDSTRIAFSAKRGDKEDPSQIYVLDMTGPGEAIQITSLVTGAGKPRWSPDGRLIAFESRVYPGAMTDEDNEAEKTARDERKTNVSAYEIFPIRQWDRWRDDLETHLFVQEAKPDAEATDLLAGTKLVAGPGFAGVPSLSGESLLAEWTPEGDGLVFSATTNLNEAAFGETYYHLYQVPAGGGEPSQLTDSTDWSCHSARFAPNGRTLVCLVDPVSEYIYNLTELGSLDWPVSGDPVVLTESFDRSVSGFEFSRDSLRLYLTAMDDGRVRVFRLPAKGGAAVALDADSTGVYSGPQSAGRSLVARWESSAVPAEIVRIDPRSGTHTPLTEFNRERKAQLDRPAYREFWFESERGRRIHNYMALPPAFDSAKKYPLVLLIHGGPHSSWLDRDHVRWSPHLLAAPGYVVLMTDYTGSVGYGETFARNIQGDPLKTPADEVLEAADEAIRRYAFIDGDRLAAAGASYGGHLVNWLQGTTTRFRTLVSHAGLVDMEGQWSTSDVIYHREIMAGGPPWGDSPIWTAQSPSKYADNFSTPMLLTIGEKDYRVPVNQTIAAWSYLKRKDVPGRLLVFHDANHWIMKGAEARYYWEEVHAWLEKYLQP